MWLPQITVEQLLYLKLKCGQMMKIMLDIVFLKVFIDIFVFEAN